MYNYSKRHNKFLLPVPAKAIYGSFCRTENEIFNVVNYSLLVFRKAIVIHIRRVQYVLYRSNEGEGKK